MKLFRNMGPYEWRELSALLHSVIGGVLVAVAVYVILSGVTA